MVRNEVSCHFFGESHYVYYMITVTVLILTWLHRKHTMVLTTVVKLFANHVENCWIFFNYNQ